MIKPRAVEQIVSDIKRSSAHTLAGELCDITGAAHCVVTTGGHMGIALALRACGVKPGDMVVCPAFGEPSLLHAILWAGAIPMFADIDYDTWLMDGYHLEYALDKCVRMDWPLPIAAVASNLFGTPYEYEELEAICKQYGVMLIEDMRGSLGAGAGERRSGCFGDYSASLPAHGADIAAVFCRDQESYYKLRQYAKLFAGPGMTAIDTARQSLPYLEKEIKERTRVAREYQKHLGDYAKTQQIKKGFYSAHSGFAIALPDESATRIAREKLAEKKSLPSDSGLPCKLYKLAEEAGLPRAVMTNAGSIADRLLPLPINPYMNSKTIAQIAHIAVGE